MNSRTIGTTVGLLTVNRRALRWRIAAVAIAALMGWGCSKESTPAPEKAAPEPPSQVAKKAGPTDEDLPPVVRLPWKGDLDEIVKRRVVRVLLPFRRPEFFYMEGRPVGILQEAFQELERLINIKYKTKADSRIVVALLPTSQDRLRERMLEGYGDIAAFGISITDENRKLVDFTIPTMTGLKIVVVTGPGAPPINSVEDLSGKDVWILPGTRLKHDLDALNARLQSQGKAPAKPREADPALEPGDVMEMVNAGLYPITLMQSAQAAFWGQVFENVKVRTDLTVAEDVELGWAIHKGTPKLKALLDDVIKTHGVGTAFGSTLLRRYLKDARYVRNATEANEMKKFRATSPIFRKYADKYNLEFLLMVAQGYQESRLDQSAKSSVGAVGIMQVMPSTAATPPVSIRNIHDIENNIHAGMRLMNFLIEDHFNETGLDRINRTLFAIAAYNAGPARITRCREMAKEMGYDPNRWFGNVEVAVAKVVGRETTQYVANIYKYYIAYRMARETLTRRDEAVGKASGKGGARQ